MSIRVKICGNTNLEDARAAVELGAWAIGMIFHRPSPRRCRLEDAGEITRALRRQVELCGVFVNPTLDRVAGIADELGLTMLQLHGDEGPAFCAEAARRTGCKVMKAARVRSGADLIAMEPFHTDYHLLDAHAKGRRGGTGESWDWRLVARRRSGTPLVVSGGLRPDNVADAIAFTRPFGVDVASGVEAEPGRKDPGKLEAFFAAVEASGSGGGGGGQTLKPAPRSVSGTSAGSDPLPAPRSLSGTSSGSDPRAPRSLSGSSRGSDPTQSDPTEPS